MQKFIDFINHLFQRTDSEKQTVETLWPTWIREYAELKAWSDCRAFERRMVWGRKYVFPVCGTKAPVAVSTEDVVRAMQLANDVTKHTQRKVQTALSQFLRWCESKKLRPTTYRLPTDPSLIEPLMGVKVRGKEGHHPAVDWREVPRFVLELRRIDTTSSRALLFLILTASRSQPVRMAQWGEINKTLKEWHIPADHMKGKQGNNRPHDVPLSRQALKLLAEIGTGHESPEAPIFDYGGEMMSDATMRKCLRSINRKVEKKGEAGFRDPSEGNRVAVPHGFRAAFATWAQENGQDLSVVERCLAHVDGADRYRGAYRRGTQIKQRRLLLQRWADYCYREVIKAESSDSDA